MLCEHKIAFWLFILVVIEASKLTNANLMLLKSVENISFYIYMKIRLFKGVLY